MNDDKTDNELSTLFSTYGLITAQRILARYQISLLPEELSLAINNPFSFYHRILQIPIKNVLNGIVLQQANDYHVYAQKLFIDYLLSGESSKEPNSQGASTREAMEEERVRLVALGEDFHKLELEHSVLISESQKKLIGICKNWSNALETTISLFSKTLKGANVTFVKSNIKHAINAAIIHIDFNSPEYKNNKYCFIEKANELLKLNLSSELKDKLMKNLTEQEFLSINLDEDMNEYVERTKIIAEQAHSYRTQFYNTILRINELINLLPEYKINPEQDAINREPLYFDNSIGG